VAVTVAGASRVHPFGRGFGVFRWLRVFQN
jgi:hypothetical protein